MTNKPGDIFVEYKQIGAIVSVTAVDAATGIEVSFQAPANTSKSHLEHMAMNKVKYVLEKKRQS